MEQSKGKSSYFGKGTGFYCNLDIGYSASVRKDRYHSAAKRTESHKNRGENKERK